MALRDASEPGCKSIEETQAKGETLIPQQRHRNRAPGLDDFCDLQRLRWVPSLKLPLGCKRLGRLSLSKYLKRLRCHLQTRQNGPNSPQLGDTTSMRSLRPCGQRPDAFAGGCMWLEPVDQRSRRICVRKRPNQIQIQCSPVEGRCCRRSDQLLPRSDSARDVSLCV